jgi:protein-L-isoaspartate(D-aspartate) O-methyltransferase
MVRRPWPTDPMTRRTILQLLTLLFPGCRAMAEADFAAARERMIATIQSLAETAERGGRRIDPRVLDAMRRVPRHLLVPEAARASAYDNGPLAIGHGQTISQPFIVALMTDLLRPQADDVVLEVGTGSGYQAAVLAHLVARVYTIEIVEPLAARAAADLERLGYRNVMVRAGDGYAGWPEAGPFDGIVVTAGAPHIPPKLVEQLKPGGRMAIPVGAEPRHAMLTLVEKHRDGGIATRPILPVSFVPLTGEARR